MPGARHLTDVEFAPAPIGGRVRFTTIFALGALTLVLGGACTGLLLDGSPPPWPVWLFLPAVPMAIVLAFYGSRVRRYRLVGDELQVEGQWRTGRYPLAALVDVAPNREAMRGAFHLWGNDGLGARAGRFRSRRLGDFRAHVTDGERAVVLRWPDRCLVVSPAQPQEFVDAVRARRAGRY